MDLFADNLKIEDLGVAIRLFRESREGFLKLFDNSPVCMSMTTTDLEKRVYKRVNKKFLERFGYAEANVIDHTSIEVGILDARESERVGALIKEKGRLQNDYVKCRAKDGTIVHTISSIEIMDMNKETYLVSFFVDITKIIEQQAIIEQHAAQLEAINKELEAFSYSVSHDLRAPLRAIDGYTRILEEDFYPSFNDEGKKVLTVVKTNVKKMNHLIDDLLAFARLGKKAIVKGDIDMNHLVDEVLADLKKTLNHRAELKVGVLHPLKGDLSLIRQVMINLLTNAIKYSSKKEHPVVEIASELQGDLVIYTVSDNGQGFDMNYIDKLFGVFQRLHTQEEFEGTGVGLATVQRIIHKHGGTIRAEAEVSKGAIFSFTLPVS